MADLAIRSGVILAAGLLGFSAVAAPQSRADPVGYLVNVTVRPGYYFFPDAEAALAYGNGICAKVAGHRSYPALVGDVQADLGTTDDYQASYLISQAVDELCPVLIWQLRNAAANYRPAPP